MLSRTIYFCCFSPEIFASFLAQYIYVISADILALFHPLAAESRALPVIFRAGCSSTGKDAANQKIMEEVQRFSGRNLKKVQEEIQQIIIISPTRCREHSFGGDFPGWLLSDQQRRCINQPTINQPTPKITLIPLNILNIRPNLNMKGLSCCIACLKMKL